MQINLSRVKTSRDVFDFGSERARKFVINKPDFRKPLVYSELFGVIKTFFKVKRMLLSSRNSRRPYARNSCRRRGGSGWSVQFKTQP